METSLSGKVCGFGVGDRVRYSLRSICMMAALLGLGAVTAIAVGAQAIPKDKVDLTMIYWGNASGFEKAGSVKMDKIIKSTPEYDQIKSKKIERGTGKYWILLSGATDRAKEAIVKTADETDYDFIAAKDYLEQLDPKIEFEDITDLIVAKIEDRKKGRK